MPRPFYLPLVEPGVLLSLKATIKKKSPDLRAFLFYRHFTKRKRFLSTAYPGKSRKLSNDAGDTFGAQKVIGRITR